MQAQPTHSHQQQEQQHVRLHSTGGIVIRPNNNHIHPHCKKHQYRSIANTTSVNDFVNSHEIIIVRSTYLNKPELLAQRQQEERQKMLMTFGLPKGHIESEETELGATYREIYEETGVQKDHLMLIGKIGTIHKPDKNNRKVHLYLFQHNARHFDSKNEEEEEEERIANLCGHCLDEVHAKDVLLEPVLKEEVAEARWAPLKHIISGEVQLKPEMFNFLREHLNSCFDMYMNHHDADQAQAPCSKAEE